MPIRILAVLACLLAFDACAADTRADEARIDVLVAELNAANRRPDVPNLFGRDTGTMAPGNLGEAALPDVESVAVPLEDDTLADSNPADPATNAEPAAPEPPPEPTFVRGDVLTFEQLPKVVGRRIRVRTVTGRTYDGELAGVRNGELTLSVRMYGAGSTVMPIKKAQVSAMSVL
ncbi:MAG: hypothetical protein IPK97_08815 [Ahniella sp.]|nr:hypothetical protein [Ahniella sp.]